VTDEELTDRWEHGEVFAGGINHEQHLRIAWVLHRRHGAAEARKRLLDGTKTACERHGCPEKFNPTLTARWANAVASAMAGGSAGASATAFLEQHPHLLRSDLFTARRVRSLSE
jgi:hypothetical protein